MRAMLLLAVLSIVAPLSAQDAPGEWAAPEMPVLITADPEPPGFTLQFNGCQYVGQLFVTDGASGDAVPLPTEPGAAVAVHWSTRVNGHWRFATVTVQNRGEDAVRLEVGLRAQLELPLDSFFDGERVSDVARERISDRFTGRFPLSAVWNDELCFAMGYLPDQWLSYIRHAYHPSGTGGTLETATRIVVDPGSNEEVEFLIGGFASEWGHREALHWYYETFPVFFQPFPGVDDRANLNGGSYLAWTAVPDPELCRRLRVGWEWCYAPFKRTGDIYGRQELWDYTPVRDMSNARSASLRDYHEARRAQFDSGNACDVAMMCYIPSQIWCEEQLARDRYPDALITDARVKTYFDTPWVTGHDNELRVFPFATSFGEQSLSDMSALVAENNIQGFAFDTANGGGRYFGPGVSRCPGRAWDDRGVFVDEGVAIGKLMEWCHANRDTRGRPLAVVSNPGASPCFLTPFRSDAAMIEADPTSVNSGSAQVLRNFLGHKTMVFWENYELEELLDYENMSTADMADALDGLADYTIIASLRMAAIPTPRICRGIRKLSQWTPLLTEVARAGWQPVPAARCDAGLPMTRAGRGLAQFITTGNETGETVDAMVTIDNSWLADGATIFIPEGSDVARSVVRDGATGQSISVPSRGACVLRSVATFRPAPDTLSTQVVRQADLDETTLRISVECPANTSAHLLVPAWDEYSQVTARFAGDDVEFEQTAEGWRSKTALQLGPASELVVRLVSRTFAFGRERLWEFDWVIGERPGYAIVVRPDAPETVRYAAQRLADYFPYFYRHGVEPPVDMPPAQIIEPGRATELSRISLTVDTEAQPDRHITCSRDGKGIRVTGRSAEEVLAAVYELLSALDVKHPYAGGLVGTEAVRNAGLAGKEVR